MRTGKSLLRRRCEHGLLGGRQVYAAGVGNYLDAAGFNFRQQRCDNVNEVARVAGLRFFHLLAGHNRHGHFSQVVEYQVVQLAAVYQLLSGGAGIAPKSRGAADTY